MQGTVALAHASSGDSAQKYANFSVAWILNLPNDRRADPMADTNRLAATSAQKVVVVDGNAEGKAFGEIQHAYPEQLTP